ncbi:hypothetical protein VPH35_105088 [Triticum aestivum]|uniref:lysine-rich arabinogalactan protein 19 isoform X1 n=1 Tax=Triticum aestivum TaxID=4565 RepID=UPI001D035C9F|nr:lysine-rich arabinogalactan protein 19-like isoform X1 [Triticum aestivum]
MPLPPQVPTTHCHARRPSASCASPRASPMPTTRHDSDHGVQLLALEAPSGTDPVLPHYCCWSPAPNAVEPASPPKNLMAEGPCSSMPWPPYPLGPWQSLPLPRHRRPPYGAPSSTGVRLPPCPLPHLRMDLYEGRAHHLRAPHQHSKRCVERAL